MIKENKFILINIIVIFSLYTLFFTSNMFSEQQSPNFDTPLNEKINITETFSITIYEWSYNKNQNKMEVIISKENNNIGENVKPRYEAITISQQKVNVKTIIDDEKMTVLHLENIPKNFKAISLRLIIDKTIKRIYKNNVNIQNKDNIREMSKKDYLLNNIENNIIKIENQIKDFEKEIEEYKNNILIKQKEIKNIEEDKKYQTKKEILTSEEKIKKINTEIKSIEYHINNKKKEIEELREKIEKLNIKKQEID